MALLEDGIGKIASAGLGTSIGIAVGVVVLAPVLFSLAGRVARPVAKAAIKTGLRIYERGKSVASEGVGAVQGMLAESKAEPGGHGEKGPQAVVRETETSPEATNQAAVEQPAYEQQSGRQKPWIVRGW